MQRHLRPVLLALALLLTLAVSCGGSATNAPTSPTSLPPEPPPPVDATTIARQLVTPNVEAWLLPRDIARHSAGRQIDALGLLPSAFQTAGLDWHHDVDVAYAVAVGITVDDPSVVVLRHTLSEQRAQDALVKLSSATTPPGEALDGLGMPAGTFNSKGHRYVLALPAPGFAILLPDSLSQVAPRFRTPGGLTLTATPAPASILAFSKAPADTLRPANGPPIPPTLHDAQARVTLNPDGSADIALDAESTTPEQAQADADALTRSVDRATSFRISILKIRVFDPVQFRAEETRVKADIHLKASEVTMLLKLAASHVRRF